MRTLVSHLCFLVLEFLNKNGNGVQIIHAVCAVRAAVIRNGFARTLLAACRKYGALLRPRKFHSKIGRLIAAGIGI